MISTCGYKSSVSVDVVWRGDRGSGDDGQGRPDDTGMGPQETYIPGLPAFESAYTGWNCTI